MPNPSAADGDSLALTISRRLRSVGSAEDAVAMKAYMKGVSEFIGVKSPERRRIVHAEIKPVRDPEIRWRASQRLWHSSLREEKYAALDIIDRIPLTGDRLAALESMMADCDHWDLLDYVVKFLDILLREDPALRRERVREWRASDHLWTRRAAILAQLKSKTATDTDLLVETIAVLRGEREFFIQKAIGWSLREYAKTDPEWVRRVVDELALTGLARREALKHL